MPYQCKITLKYSQSACIGRPDCEISCYFLVFCLIEEIYHVVPENKVILGLTVNCVIHCYYYVMSD